RRVRHGYTRLCRRVDRGLPNGRRAQRCPHAASAWGLGPHSASRCDVPTAGEDDQEREVRGAQEWPSWRALDSRRASQPRVGRLPRLVSCYDSVDILHHPSRESHMFARWSVRVGLACSLACYPLALQGQDKSLQQRIADDFIALAGGVHPRYRIAHAKGIDATGTFAPSRGATSPSRAPHLVTASTPVIARYSN